MDAFDFTEEQVQPRRRNSPLVWNILTVIVLLLTICACGVFLALFINPYGGYNPFPPPTMPPTYSPPSATPTPRSVLPPTWTPTLTPLVTDTPIPTPTSIPSQTPVGGAGTPVASTPPPGGMPYILQPGNPVAIPNIARADLGCNWMGVSGQALGMNDGPVVGLLVQLGGVLDGKTMDLLGMTGTAPQYGAGGYEFTLTDQPIASKGKLWVQLFDQAMLPLSEKIIFDTFAECEKSLILINFKQVR